MDSRNRKLSLKKSAFVRLIIITFLAVLIFYIIGLSINKAGMQNMKKDLQEQLAMRTDYVASQIEQEFTRLNFFMLELMSNKDLLRYTISHSFLADYERLVYIRTLSDQEYMIKRSSDLADSVQIMFPDQKKTIITDQALYADLDERLWGELLARTKKNRVSTTIWEGRLWMLLPRYEGDRPMFMIAISVSQDSLTKKLDQLCGGQTDSLLLMTPDRQVLALSGNDQLFKTTDGDILSEHWKDNRTFHARTQINLPNLMLLSAYQTDDMMAPFVTYRNNLWILTAFAFGLLLLYIGYYWWAIMRPINDLLESMRKAGENGSFHIETDRKSEYDDIYLQYNEMVRHVHKLAEQVYEERYRAQKAELKQLQVQIDPHFLYNTLYLIYRIARSDGNAAIASLSLNLSNYYRYITKMPEQIVALRDEIRHVMNYLEIQKIRFAPRISIEAQELPAEIADERIPSLIIQPIVENAFQHGIKDCVKDGLVTLRYEVDSSWFSVIVSDNSGKMTDEKVAALWAAIQQGEVQESNALRNLYRRMQLYESSGHELVLKCVNGGLTAVLTFRRRENNASITDRR